MTTNEREAFVRELRYVVIKGKDLSDEKLKKLCRYMMDNQIPTRKCVVVEADWPEYEPVWTMIEARMTGHSALQSVAQPVSVPDAYELWAAAQLVPGEGIEDGARRIEAMLSADPAYNGKKEE